MNIVKGTLGIIVGVAAERLRGQWFKSMNKSHATIYKVTFPTIDLYYSGKHRFLPIIIEGNVFIKCKDSSNEE